MYRAPIIEWINQDEVNFGKQIEYEGQDADLFALGVAILIAKTSNFPWKKANFKDSNYQLFADDYSSNVEAFWSKITNVCLKDDFKNFIEGMLTISTRPVLVDILGHDWMRGTVCTK